MLFYTAQKEKELAGKGLVEISHVVIGLTRREQSTQLNKAHTHNKIEFEKPICDK